MTSESRLSLLTAPSLPIVGDSRSRYSKKVAKLRSLPSLPLPRAEFFPSLVFSQEPTITRSEAEPSPIDAK